MQQEQSQRGPARYHVAINGTDVEITHSEQHDPGELENGYHGLFATFGGESGVEEGHLRHGTDEYRAVASSVRALKAENVRATIPQDGA